MLDAPERRGPTRRRGRPAVAPTARGGGVCRPTSTRRALLLTALGGLLIAGVDHRDSRGADGKGPIGLNAGTIALGARAATTPSTTPRAATA